MGLPRLTPIFAAGIRLVKIGAKGENAMNVLRGKVMLKQTNAGIPGLIVVIGDAALPAGVIADPAPAAVSAGVVAGDGGTPPATDPATSPKASIGSRVTGSTGTSVYDVPVIVPLAIISAASGNLGARPVPLLLHT
jgi:hypothetical protein